MIVRLHPQNYVNFIYIQTCNSIQTVYIKITESYCSRYIYYLDCHLPQLCDIVTSVMPQKKSSAGQRQPTSTYRLCLLFVVLHLFISGLQNHQIFTVKGWGHINLCTRNIYIYICFIKVCLIHHAITGCFFVYKTFCNLLAGFMWYNYQFLHRKIFLWFNFFKLFSSSRKSNRCYMLLLEDIFSVNW